MKLALFIPSLEVGGAERQMVLLARALMEKGHTVSLWCLRAAGPFVDETKQYGIPVRDVNKGGRYDLIGAAMRLREISRKDQPDVIISCLPSANLYALLLRRIGHRIFDAKPRLIWGLASAKLPVGEYGWWAKISYWVQARSARLADKVVVNSVAGFESAKEEGYPIAKLQVIHNGVDMQRFQFDEEGGKRWRRDMLIDKDALVIGMVGRLDPAKNYEVFLRACEIAAEKSDRIQFVIVGGGDNEYAQQLHKRICSHQLFGSRLFHKLNETNMPQMYSALDLMTLTSKSEGLPNTVVEAMACGKHCVVTDVGDCRLAVDRFGMVCEVGDAMGIAEAWLSVLHDDFCPTLDSGHAGSVREYMEGRFSLEKMTSQFELACIKVSNDDQSGH